MSTANMQINVGANVTQAVAGLNQVNQAATQTATTLNKVKAPTDAAAFALTNLGRVAQDAPFGFVAIQNNLNPLLESFQRLKVQAAEAGVSLGSTLKSALTGPGGIGIALSVVSAAITVFSNGLGAWTRGFGGAAEAAKKAKDAGEEWEKGIHDINKTLGQEATQIGIIVGLLDTQKLSREQQTEAIKKLIDIAPEYFGSLNKEKASIDQINVAYATYLANLDKQFEAKSIEVRLQDLYNKKLDISSNIEQYKELTTRISQLNAELLSNPTKVVGGVNVRDFDRIAQINIELTKLRSQAGQAFSVAFGGNILQKDDVLANVNKEIDSLLTKRVALGNMGIIPPGDDAKGKSAIELLRDSRSELEKQLKLLQEIDKAGKLPIFRQHEIADLQTQILKIDAVIDKLPQVNVDIKNDIIQEALDKKVTALPPLELKKGEVYVEVAPTFKLVEGKFALDSAGGLEKSDVRTARKGIEDSINTQLAANPLNLHPSVVITRMSIDQKAVKAAIDLLNNSITNYSRQAFADLGASIGESIGNAITGGGLTDAFSAVGDIIANFFKQIGKAFLEYGATLLIAKTAIKSLNPYLAIAAGVAFEIAGAALSNSLKQTPFAEGGIVTGPTNALIGEAGTEFVLPLSRMNQFVKSIQGTGGAMEISGTGVLRGNDIYIAYNRAQKTNNRIN